MLRKLIQKQKPATGFCWIYDDDGIFNFGKWVNRKIKSLKKSICIQSPCRSISRKKLERKTERKVVGKVQKSENNMLTTQGTG